MTLTSWSEPLQSNSKLGTWSEFGLLGTWDSLRVELPCGSLALLEKGWMRKGRTKLFAKFMTLSYTAASLSDLHSSVCSKHETAGLCIKAGGVLKASCLSCSSCIKDHVPVQVKSWLSEQFMSTYRCCCMGGMQGGCQNLGFTIKSAWWFWNLLSGSALLTSVSATWNRFQPPRRWFLGGSPECHVCGPETTCCSLSSPLPALLCFCQDLLLRVLAAASCQCAALVLGSSISAPTSWHWEGRCCKSCCVFLVSI